MVEGESVFDPAHLARLGISGDLQAWSASAMRTAKAVVWSTGWTLKSLLVSFVVLESHTGRKAIPPSLETQASTMTIQNTSRTLIKTARPFLYFSLATILDLDFVTMYTEVETGEDA